MSRWRVARPNRQGHGRVVYRTRRRRCGSRLDLPRERVHFHEVVAPSYPLFVTPPYTLALEKLSRTDVGTVVCMHLSEEHIKEAEKNHVNAVIAGHIASDNLGINLADAMRAKLAKNEFRYPVDKARGSNKKYNEL